MEKDKNIGNQDVLFEDIVKGKAKLRKPIKFIIPLVAIVSVGLISISLFNNKEDSTINNQLSENINEINKVIDTNNNKLLTKSNTDYLDEMIKDLQKDMTEEEIKKRDLELSKQIEKEVDLYNSGNDVIESGEIKTINIEKDSISKVFNELNDLS